MTISTRISKTEYPTRHDSILTRAHMEVLCAQPHLRVVVTNLQVRSNWLINLLAYSSCKFRSLFLELPRVSYMYNKI